MRANTKRILLLCVVLTLVCSFLYSCQDSNKGNTNVNIEGVTPVKVASIRRAAQEYSKYINNLENQIHIEYFVKLFKDFKSLKTLWSLI